MNFFGLDFKPKITIDELTALKRAAILQLKSCCVEIDYSAKTTSPRLIRVYKKLEGRGAAESTRTSFYLIINKLNNEF